MAWIRRFLLWTRALTARKEVENELSREMRFHLDMEVEKNLRDGMTPEDAQRRALVDFGGVQRFREEVNDERGTRALGDMGTDLRYGVRTLLRSPAYSLASVLALALGIGASAALFSVVNGVLLRPLPYAGQERLVIVDAERRRSRTIPSYLQFLDWRARARSFDGMAYTFGEAFLLRTNEGTEAVGIAMVSEGFFGLMGAKPALGRLPSVDEEQDASQPVIVISHGLWRGHFGNDPDVVGRSLDTDKGSFMIVGVMPPGFAFPSWASAWTPLAPVSGQFPALAKRDWRADARAIARLRPNVGIGRATRDLNAVARALAVELPATDSEMSARLTPLVAAVVGDVRGPLALFAGAVLLLLVIACANVGTLSLVRVSTRLRELAVRSALGASGRRIVSLFLSEGAVLAAAGATLGLIFAFWMLELLRLVAPAGLPRLDEIALDGRTFGFTAIVTVSTLLLFGLAPAIYAARLGITEALRSGTSTSSRLRIVRLRSALLVAQVALSLALLVGAGLLVRSFVLLRAVPRGFDAERLLAVRIQPPAAHSTSPEALLGIYAQVRDEIVRLPGVTRLSLVNHQGDAGIRVDVRVPGQPADPGAEPRALYRLVYPDYFATVGQRLLRGGGFTAADMSPASRVAVVNAQLAALLWPGSDPLGQRLQVSKQVPGRSDFGESLDVEVVGVVVDAVFTSPGGPALNVVYLPFSVNPTDQASFMVRTDADPITLVAPVRRAIVAVDRNIPTNRIGALTDSAVEGLLRRFDLVALGVFAASALVLAAIGLFGVVAYVVSQRRHEIGIRRAVGASDAQLLRQFVGQGVRLAAIGIAVGLPFAAVAGRLLRTMLFGVAPFDPPTFAAVATLLLTVAALASYLPARRLSEISPVEALRAE